MFSIAKNLSLSRLEVPRPGCSLEEFNFRTRLGIAREIRNERYSVNGQRYSVNRFRRCNVLATSERPCPSRMFSSSLAVFADIFRIPFIRTRFRVCNPCDAAQVASTQGKLERGRECDTDTLCERGSGRFLDYCLFRCTMTMFYNYKYKW